MRTAVTIDLAFDREHAVDQANRFQRPRDRPGAGDCPITVQENLGRAAQAGLAWPLPAELTDDALAGNAL